MTLNLSPTINNYGHSSHPWSSLLVSLAQQLFIVWMPRITISLTAFVSHSSITCWGIKLEMFRPFEELFRLFVFISPVDKTKATRGKCTTIIGITSSMHRWINVLCRYGKHDKLAHKLVTHSMWVWVRERQLWRSIAWPKTLCEPVWKTLSRSISYWPPAAARLIGIATTAPVKNRH